MKFTPLLTAPTQIYLLSYRFGTTALVLACLPDGGILRSQFQQQDTLASARNRLSEACTKRWPQAAIQQAVWKQLSKLQSGSTISYSQLATQIGQPTAYRAVGNAVGANPYAPFIACHRVLAGNGQIGGFAGGTELKRQLLQAEGGIY